MKKVSDILIIGGGVIGLSCAWRLAQKGAKVTLLERGLCGCGSSGASLGALWPSPASKQGPLQQIHRQALWEFDHFVEEIESATGVPIGYERRGRMVSIDDEKQYRQLQIEVDIAIREWPKQLGEPIMALVNASEAQTIEPCVPTGEFGALVCNATAQVQPEGMIQALRQVCKNIGVEVQENEPIEELKVDGGRVQEVKTPTRTYSTPIVLVTAGAWTSLLSPSLKKHAPVLPLKGQAMLLRVERPLFSRIVKSGSIYLIRRGDREVIVGSTTEPEAGFDDSPTEEAKILLWEGAIRLIPALSTASIERHWAGIRPSSAIRKPIMGPMPGIEGLFVATGHGKIGIGLAPVTGQWMAEWILDGAPSQDLSTFAPK